MKPTIVIIGGGGHGKVVFDAVIAQGSYQVVGFMDSILAVGTTVVQGYKVVLAQSEMDSLAKFCDHFVVAVGNNTARREIFQAAQKIVKPATIIHPSAVIGSEVKIGKGSVVLANAVINSHSSIGENSIVNSGVIIDHECHIGSHTHLATGVVVGSNSEVGNDQLLLVGEKIKSFSKIV